MEAPQTRKGKKEEVEDDDDNARNDWNFPHDIKIVARKSGKNSSAKPSKFEKVSTLKRAIINGQ